MLKLLNSFMLGFSVIVNVVIVDQPETEIIVSYLRVFTYLLLIFFMQQEEEVATTDPETRRKHFYQIEKSLVVSRFARRSHSVLELVSRKSRNFPGAFRVT